MRLEAAGLQQEADILVRVGGAILPHPNTA
jgi:hypothetical protein